jgi:hypothetical protein
MTNLWSCSPELLQVKTAQVCLVVESIEASFRKDHAEYETSMCDFILCMALLNSAAGLQRTKQGFLAMAEAVWDGYSDFQEGNKKVTVPHLRVVKGDD